MKKKWKKLVLTEVSPSGWLKEQMQMQMNGLTGCLHEKWDSVGTYSGWLGGTGESWERGPYYLDGLLPLSYYLKDEKHFEICKKFLDWTLKSLNKSHKSWNPLNKRVPRLFLLLCY